MSDNSEPINPIPMDKDQIQYIKYESYGLTKREHFAGLAMQGSLSADPDDELSPEQTAKFAVRCADALISELGKKQ